MTAYAPPQSSPAPAQANPAVWQRVLDFVVRRRIAISLVAFIALIIEDVLTGVRPHDLTNLSDWHTAVGLTLVGAGLAIRSWAGGTLTKWGELTVSGPYGIIRHPLYVGSFLMMIGFCLIIDDSENLCFVLGPLLVLYLVHVGQEGAGCPTITAPSGMRMSRPCRDTCRGVCPSCRWQTGAAASG